MEQGFLEQGTRIFLDQRARIFGIRIEGVRNKDNIKQGEYF